MVFVFCAHCFANVMKIASMRKWLNVLVFILFSLAYLQFVCTIFAHSCGGNEVSSGLHTTNQTKAIRPQQIKDIVRMFGVYLFCVERKVRVFNGDFYFIACSCLWFVHCNEFLPVCHIVFNITDEMVSSGWLVPSLSSSSYFSLKKMVRNK